MGWADWFAAAGSVLCRPRRRFARFEHMFFALEAALDGLGVALMPSALVVDEHGAPGRLVDRLECARASMSAPTTICCRH